MEAEVEAVVEVVAVVVGQRNVATNHLLGLWAAPRLQKALGRGRHKFVHRLVLRSAVAL